MYRLFFVLAIVFSSTLSAKSEKTTSGAEFIKIMKEYSEFHTTLIKQLEVFKKESDLTDKACEDFLTSFKAFKALEEKTIPQLSLSKEEFKKIEKEYKEITTALSPIEEKLMEEAKRLHKIDSKKVLSLFFADYGLE